MTNDHAEQHPITRWREAQPDRPSEADLGRRLGVNVITVLRWERGDTLPQKRHWPKLTEITGIPIDVILAAGIKGEAA